MYRKMMELFQEKPAQSEVAKEQIDSIMPMKLEQYSTQDEEIEEQALEIQNIYEKMVQINALLQQTAVLVKGQSYSVESIHDLISISEKNVKDGALSIRKAEKADSSFCCII